MVSFDFICSFNKEFYSKYYFRVIKYRSGCIHSKIQKYYLNKNVLKNYRSKKNKIVVAGNALPDIM